MKYKIPLFDLNFDDAEIEAVTNVLKTKWISMGPAVAEFEKKFGENLSVKHVVAVSSCTAALHLAMKVLGIGEGDEVILPSLTFVATANAVMYVGAKPVFVDIEGPENLGIDVNDIYKKVNKKTKAIIVMHYGGFSCDMGKIKDLASEKSIYIVEDSAHAPLSRFNELRLGTIGDIGCFSFFSNKNISCAEGGALVTNNSALAEKAKLLRSHGMTTISFERAKGHASTYDVVDLGYNYRLDDIRANLILAQLNKLEKDCERRNFLRKLYIDMLCEESDIILPYLKHDHYSSNYIFPIVLKTENEKIRDRVRLTLKKTGIETSVHYPAVHRFKIYNKYTTSLEKTDYVSQNEITLPLYYSLTEDNINYICTQVRRAMN